jgi:hypothetical protein
MNTVDKKSFDSWPRDRKIVFIAVATGGSFSPAGIPGFLFYEKASEPFAIVFEIDDAGSFSRIDSVPFLDAIKECKEFNNRIISEKAKAASVPTMEEFNAWNMMQRSAWIYNEWDNGDKPAGLKVKGSP